ncbi:unnamed protein product [Phytophthora fragariaefolia]|uniref:Unnamed protein product n=1 Tax=Phytophthora fragariaefolia TaxID=1490495 RepID=A0A9W6XWB8_9STRA|nr:unnamed protein product [Phytophthora fragariaefolia]
MSTPQPVFEGIVATVKGSVGPVVLKTLSTYVLKKPVEDVDDAEVMAQVQKRCKSLKNAVISDVTTLYRKQLKLGMTLDDCDARVFQYFQAFTKIVEDNDLQGVHAHSGTSRCCGSRNPFPDSDAIRDVTDAAAQRFGVG